MVKRDTFGKFGKGFVVGTILGGPVGGIVGGLLCVFFCSGKCKVEQNYDELTQISRIIHVSFLKFEKLNVPKLFICHTY